MVWPSSWRSTPVRVHGEMLPNDDVEMSTSRLLRDERGIRRVRVIGHSDHLGDAAFNRWLSRERAHAVVAWLVRQGISRNRFVVDGVGDTEPAVQAETPDQLGPNRRVEFEIVDPAGGVVRGQ